MHLGVVHPRLEARGRPFPRYPMSRSRVNLRVLRPLTRGPHGQPSPRPGVQGIFPTSHCQAPHGWPMVHHSLATGSPIPRVCCCVFSAAPPTLLRSPATSLSPVPRSVTHLCLFPAPLVFPFPWGCCVALATGPSLSVAFSHTPVFLPRRAASNPVARAHWIPSIRGPFRAPCTGRPLPAPAVPCATSFHPSQPILGAPRLPMLQGLLCGPSQTAFSVPSPYPIFPCLHPTGPPATLRCGPTGSSSIRGPFRAPSTGRFYLKVLPWVVVGAGGLGAGKTSGAGTRGVSLDVVIGGRTGYSDTNGGESSDNRSKVHADCYPAENPSL